MSLFTLIPAIDIKNRQCVRLKQGRMQDATVFAENPLDAAKHWYSLGARRLHVVDLDGAFAGKPVNHLVAQKIVQEFTDLQVQVGGGNRCMQDIQKLFDYGVSYCILGTSAVKKVTFVEQAAKAFPQKIILGLDAKNGRIATEGWADYSDLTAVELVKRFENLPLAEVIYTDIVRDGMLNGINLKATCDLAKISAFSIIASGGVSCLQDVEDLLATDEVKHNKISGLIAGRAIYTNHLNYKQAVDLIAFSQAST